jgi:GNAT superfamily N-acetyltransferase
MTLEEATEVFCTAFSAIKSRTYPYLLERQGGLRIMRDKPGRASPRKTEVIAVGLSPSETVEQVRKADLGWHFLCSIDEDGSTFDALRAEYKALGYRAVSTEWMFVHHLRELPTLVSDPPARRVGSESEWASIPQMASQPRKLVPGRRLYGVWDAHRDYGWCESMPVGDAAWVHALHVHRDFRRRGYGGALMSALLQDDKCNGISTSVLLASSDGARLYPRLGYERIGVLQMFCPARR